MNLRQGKRYFFRKEVPLKRKLLAFCFAMLVHIALFVFVNPVITISDPLPPPQGPIDLVWEDFRPPPPPPKPVSTENTLRPPSGDHPIPEPTEMPKNLVDEEDLERVIADLNSNVNTSFSPSISNDRAGTIAAPMLIYKSIPAYPDLAIKMGFEGTVVLTLYLDEEGNIYGTEILESSGYDRLDKAALNSGKLCKFTGAVQNGKNIKVSIKLTYVFDLDQLIIN
ncbi:energy transducer TonB [bacterium]|nr:energy transducer TonB [bacterium]